MAVRLGKYKDRNMTSLTRSLLHLNESDLVGTWIRCFAAHARAKKLKDNKEYGGENEITDLF